MKKNKRLFPLLLLFLFSLYAFSCATYETDGEPLSVLHRDFCATLSVEINGSASECVYEKTGETSALTLSSPSTLSGLVFTWNQEGITLKSGDTEVSADGQIGFLPRLISSVFSEGKDAVTDIGTEKSDGTAVTVIKTPSSVYRFGRDGTPLSAEGVANGADFRIIFYEFRPTDGTETAK